jgi:hypothetical protein
VRASRASHSRGVCRFARWFRDLEKGSSPPDASGPRVPLIWSVIFGPKLGQLQAQNPAMRSGALTRSVRSHNSRRSTQHHATRCALPLARLVHSATRVGSSTARGGPHGQESSGHWLAAVPRMFPAALRARFGRHTRTWAVSLQPGRAGLSWWLRVCSYAVVSTYCSYGGGYHQCSNTFSIRGVSTRCRCAGLEDRRVRLGLPATVVEPPNRGVGDCEGSFE